MQPQNQKANYRVMYGLSVRVHPEDHPREFVSDVARWTMISANLRDALRCIPRDQRRLYSHLARAYAHALSLLQYYGALSSGQRQDQGVLGFDDPDVGA